MDEAATATGGRAFAWLAFVPVAVAYALVATWNIALPGVYMDAVNPDYLAVKLLNPAHQPIIAWVLDGNYLFGRAPWMTSLYHGSQTFWFGLPLFWLFGTSVEGLRLTHAVFGLGVLAGLHSFLLRAQLPAIAAAACGTAMALDPSFSYAFRTQSYITLAPAAWLLVSAGLLLDARAATRRARVWSGALAGFAATGYFVEGFFLGALLPAAWLALGPGPTARRERMEWLAGLALGLAPVALGYLLLMKSVGGPLALAGYFTRQQAALGAFSSTLSAGERLAYAWTMLSGVLSDAWHHMMMFRTWTPVPASGVKIASLLALPVALWLLAEWRRRASFAARLAIAMPCAFVAFALVFGSRLAGHHYVIVVPWLYAALALTLRDALAHVPDRAIAQAPLDSAVAQAPGAGEPAHSLRVGPSVVGRAAPARVVAAMAAVALGLGAINVAGQVAEARTLRQTGGIGLMSDAINRLAADLLAMPSKPFVFFPDWGLAMPVAFLTRGNVGMDSEVDFARARAMLCAGRDVAVALITDRDRRRAQWTASLGWDALSVRHYAQRDGAVVFDLVQYHARPGVACTPAGAAAPSSAPGAPATGSVGGHAGGAAGAVTHHRS